MKCRYNFDTRVERLEPSVDVGGDLLLEKPTLPNER